MKAILVSRTGGPDVLEPTEVDAPVAGPGQVVATSHAAGVNFIDIYLRSGLYPTDLPHVPGNEGAGVVTAVGEGVGDLAVGDRIAWTLSPGSYAEQVAVNAAHAWKIPDAVAFDTAAASMSQGLTAHFLADSLVDFAPGDVALVHAGAGGVGLLLTQLLVRRGVRVITTTSTDEKAELSRAAGAEHVIDYTVADVAASVRDLTDGLGVRAVFDGVGAATFDASLDALRVRGTLVLFGGSSGPVPPFDPQVLNRKGSLLLTRPNMGHFIADHDEFTRRAKEIFDLIATGGLTVRVGATYPLSDAARAHDDLAARRTTGKLLLHP